MGTSSPPEASPSGVCVQLPPPGTVGEDAVAPGSWALQPTCGHSRSTCSHFSFPRRRHKAAGDPLCVRLPEAHGRDAAEPGPRGPGARQVEGGREAPRPPPPREALVAAHAHGPLLPLKVFPAVTVYVAGPENRLIHLGRVFHVNGHTH